MAANDIKVVKHPGGTVEYQAEDRDTSAMSATMKPGEVLKVGGTGTNFVTQVNSGEPTVGSDELVGVVAKESTETASADGVVEIITLLPVQTVLMGTAHTTTNITATNLAGYLNDWVTFEWTATVAVDYDSSLRINEDESTDPNVHGLKIIDGDITDNTLEVIVSGKVCEGAASTGDVPDAV